MERLYKDASAINGTGLFTSLPLKRGAFVGYVQGPVRKVRRFTPSLSARSENWIGIGRYTWIDTTNSPFRYINHSCAPNVALVSKRRVEAIRDIPAGTELTMDYSLTEADPAWSIPHCRCGSKQCRSRITPIYHLPASVLARYRELIPKNFVRIYHTEQRKH